MREKNYRSQWGPETHSSKYFPLHSADEIHLYRFGTTFLGELSLYSYY